MAEVYQTLNTYNDIVFNERPESDAK